MSRFVVLFLVIGLTSSGALGTQLNLNCKIESDLNGEGKSGSIRIEGTSNMDVQDAVITVVKDGEKKAYRERVYKSKERLPFISMDESQQEKMMNGLPDRKEDLLEANFHVFTNKKDPKKSTLTFYSAPLLRINFIQSKLIEGFCQ